MTEDDFWTSLEWRICREVEGWKDPAWKYVWCDGIRGHLLRPEGSSPHFIGDIWIGTSGQDRMPFSMAVPAGALEGDTVNWQALLPAEDLTGWLLVDLTNKYVAIDISKAERIAGEQP